jgi:hypothetical protein
MDHRTLEIGNCAYLLHFRHAGEDYVLRLWYSTRIDEDVRGESVTIKNGWVYQYRTESGDYSEIRPVSCKAISRLL